MIIILLCLFVSAVNCQTGFYPSDEVYNQLPPIFHIDDYDRCKADNKHFCKVAVQLTSLDGEDSSQIWKNIQRTKNESRFYNHDELFHAICVEDFCRHQILINEDYFLSPNNMNNSILECYNSKYRNIGLSANILEVDCKNYDNIYTVRIIDVIVLFVAVIYISVVVYATFCDYFQTFSDNTSLAKSTTGRYLTYFSIIHNWKKLNKPNNNPDFKRLKSMQGLRTYTMLAIIMCHTYCSYIGGYIANTRYFEDLGLYPHKVLIRNSFMFLVQAFFLFSAWLLSYHMFQIFEQVESGKVKYILVTLLNRYLRILPTVVPVIGFTGTVWVMSQFYGPIKEIYADKNFQNCQNNWWTNILFINNHYNHDQMCYFITWYLAADFQLYVLSLVILYIIWIWKRNTKTIIILSMILGIVIQGVVTYIYNTDILYRITPENSKRYKFLSFEFNSTYTSTYSNMATYMLGLGFGYIYFKYKDHEFFKSKWFEVLWWISFPGLPIGVLVIGLFKFNRIISSILVGMLKPLFALGIGIGILGMSHEVGGFLKSICEWKFAVFLGSCTYSVYLAHYGIVFSRTALTKTTMYVSDYVLISSFIQDVLLSFPSGLFVHLILELPMLQLQNEIIPQVRNIRYKSLQKCGEPTETKATS